MVAPIEGDDRSSQTIPIPIFPLQCREHRPASVSRDFLTGIRLDRKAAIILADHLRKFAARSTTSAGAMLSIDGIADLNEEDKKEIKLLLLGHRIYTDGNTLGAFNECKRGEIKFSLLKQKFEDIDFIDIQAEDVFLYAPSLNDPLDLRIITMPDIRTAFDELLSTRILDGSERGDMIDAIMRIVEKNEADKAPAEASPQVIIETTLHRLLRRYNERVEAIDLPSVGFFTTKEQAQAAGRLSTTYNELRKRQIELGLDPTAKHPRVKEAERMRWAYERREKKKDLLEPSRPGRRGRVLAASSLD